MSGALRGLKVVDFGQYVAGPLAGMLLADHGADVIHVTHPSGMAWNGAWNSILQRGKRSIALDLAGESDRAVARKLIANADVLIENFSPGVMSRFGLEYEKCRALNPGIVYCSIPGFSSTDPRHAHVPGWEILVSAASGIYMPPNTLWRTGVPLRHQTPVASVFAGLWAATGIVFALIGRRRDGFGERIEVPLYNAAVSSLGVLGTHVNDPRSEVPVPFTPWIGSYRCSDGRRIQLHLTPRFIREFMDQAGVGEWSALGFDDRWKIARDPLMRKELRLRLTALIGSHDAGYWEELAASCGSAAAICLTAGEWIEHPHARASGMFAKAIDREYGEMFQPAVNPKLGRTPGLIRRPAPGIDEDRESILSELALPGVGRKCEPPRGEVRLPLDGLRVLDLSVIIAGPTAARTFAEYGAEVIRIDHAERDIRGSYHFDVNRGKLGTMIDLKSGSGQELFWRLAGRSDVIVENWRAGVSERLGIGSDAVRRRFPQIVYCALDAYGLPGPWRGRSGWDDTAQAVTGPMMRDERLQSTLMNDYGTGIVAAFGVGLALYERGNSGIGQEVRTSLALTSGTLNLIWAGQDKDDAWSNMWSGTRSAGDMPEQGLYEAQDGWVAVVWGDAGDRVAGGLLSAGRKAGENCEPGLESAVVERFRDKTVSEWVRVLEEHGIAAQRVLDIDEAMNDPWTVRKGLSITRYHDGYGAVRTVGVAPEMMKTPVAAGKPASLMGGDIVRVLASIGEDAKIGDLIRRGVVTVEPRQRPLASIFDCLAKWAEAMPDAVAYCEAARDAGASDARVTYSELLTLVDRFSLVLRKAVDRKGRAILMLPAGIEFAGAFFACMRSGVIAVPLTPLHEDGRIEDLEMVLAAAGDCEAGAVVIPSGLESLWKEVAPSGLRKLGVVSLVKDSLPGIDDAKSAAPDEAEIACIQYTSGSTGSPKGVVLRNRDLVGVCERVRCLCEYHRWSSAVSALPMSHVTGLVCGICEPMYVGCWATLMRPDVVAANPIGWLEVISRYSGTHAGGPNYLYELCSEKRIANSELKLDLRSWRVAFVSSEAVKWRTMEEFSDAFAGVGFNRRSFQACYGQTEAMRVAASSVNTYPTTISVSMDSLRDRKIVVVPHGAPGSTRLVGHGKLDNGQVKIRLVRPGTETPCSEFEVGEILIEGAGMASGYWKKDAEWKDRVASLDIDGVQRRCLRTRDLGFSNGQELFVCGRIGEFVIVRGRNIHLEDVERTAAETIADINPACLVCFIVGAGESGEEVVLVVEVDRRPEGEGAVQLPAAERRICAAVARRQGIRIKEVVWVEPKSAPRTAAGKVSRPKCRDAYLANGLRRIVSSGQIRNGEDVRETPVPSRVMVGAPTSATETVLHEVVGRVLRCGNVSVHDKILELGVDSLTLIQLASSAQARGLPLTPAMLDGDITIAELSRQIDIRLAEKKKASRKGMDVKYDGHMPVTPIHLQLLKTWDAADEKEGQMGLCYTTNPKFFTIAGSANRETLQAAVNALVGRHEALRTAFVRRDGCWFQKTAEAAECPVRDLDLGRLKLRENAAEIASGFAGFLGNWDIGKAPLIRFVCADLHEESVIMMVTHHLASDNISERILVEDFVSAYQQLQSGCVAAASDAAASWMPACTAFWEAAERNGCGEQDVEYWRAASTNGATRPGEGASATALPAGGLVLPGGANDGWKDVRDAYFLCACDAADRMRQEAQMRYGCSLARVMLTAFVRAMVKWAGGSARIDVAVHGRDLFPEGTDVSRAVGMFFFDLPIMADISMDSGRRESTEWVRDRMTEARAREASWAILAKGGPEKGMGPFRGPVAFNYQAMVSPRDLNGSAGAMQVGLPVGPEFWSGFVQSAPPRTRTFTRRYYGDQVRWFVTDLGDGGIVLSVRYPWSDRNISRVESAFGLYEEELRWFFEGYGEGVRYQRTFASDLAIKVC